MGDTTSTNTVTNVSPHLCFTDPNHQLFIHHGDHPRVLLVSQPLTETNYHTWSRSMVMTLSAKNKEQIGIHQWYYHQACSYCQG